MEKAENIQRQFDKGLLTWGEVQMELAMLAETDAEFNEMLARVMVPEFQYRY
jgi:hypothetical protein